VNFEVSIDNRVGRPKGVYLRQPYESSIKQTLSVNVNPRFKKMDVEEETQRRRVEFEMLLNLKSTVPWVQCPDHFMLMHNGRSFKIEVDPTQLPPGVHTTKIMGYDSTNTTTNDSRGAIFSVPITVVRTLEEEPDIRIGKLEVG
jgi:tripeptidyl-peptidase-2